MNRKVTNFVVCCFAVIIGGSKAIRNEGSNKDWFSDGIGADWERLPDVFMGKLPRLAEAIESNATTEDVMEMAGSEVHAAVAQAQLPDVTDRLRARKSEEEASSNWKWPPSEVPPFHSVIAQRKVTSKMATTEASAMPAKTSKNSSKSADSQGAGTEHLVNEYPGTGYRTGKSLGYGHHGHHQRQQHYEEEEGAKPYHFAYKVKNKYGNHFGQREKSDGDTVTGEYNVLLPDGRYQTVAYWADWKTGYNARVKYSGHPKQQKNEGHHGPSYKHAQGLAEVEQQIWGRPTHSHHVYSGPPKFVEPGSKPQNAKTSGPKLPFKPSKPITTSGTPSAYQNAVGGRHTQQVPIYRYPDGGAPAVPYVYQGGPSFFKNPPTSASSFSSSTTVQDTPNTVATSPTSSYPSSSKYQVGGPSHGYPNQQHGPHHHHHGTKAHKGPKSGKYSKGPKPTRYPPPSPPVLYRPQEHPPQGPTPNPYFGYPGPTHGPVGYPQGTFYSYPTAGSYISQPSLQPPHGHGPHGPHGPGPTVEVEMHGGFRPSLPPLQPPTSTPKPPPASYSFPPAYSSPTTPFGQAQTLKNYHQDPKDPSDHSSHSHSHTYDPETGTLVIHHHHGLPNDKETGPPPPVQGPSAKHHQVLQQPSPTPPYRGIAPVQLVHSEEPLGGVARGHAGPRGPSGHYGPHHYALQPYFVNPGIAVPYGGGPPPPGYVVDADPQGTSSIPVAASNPVSVSVPILKQQKGDQNQRRYKNLSPLLAEFEVHQKVDVPASTTSTTKAPTTAKPDPGATFLHAVFRSASAEKPFKPKLFPFLTGSTKTNSSAAFRYSFGSGANSMTSTATTASASTTSTTPKAYAIEPRHPSIRRYRKGKLEGETSSVEEGHQDSDAFLDQQHQFDNMQLNRTTPAKHRFKAGKNAKVVRIR